MANNKDKNKWIDDLNNETRAFAPVSGDSSHSDGETRAFSLDESAKEPREKCEERGSLKELPTSALIWRIGRPLLILAVSVALVVFLGLSVYHYIEDSYVAPVAADTSETVHVEIGSGSSLSSIASLLYEEGIIRNKFAFQLYADLNDLGGSLKAGQYDLSPGMTMEQIADILKEGNPPRLTIKIMFLEGFTVEDMAAKLVKEGLFDNSERQEFLNLCKDADAFDDYSFIAALKSTENLSSRRYVLEGYLAPDTYQFYEDATPEDVIRKLLDQFDNVFKLEYEERAEQLGMTVDQVVTLASMIEWEATELDFKKVSAVFHNRIEREMEFDSCASMRYVTGIKKQTYTAEELKQDSPYNTYMYKGLPLGPINNPSKNAIDAALYPDEEHMNEGYIYFMNKDKTSSELVYAKTEKEQEKHKAEYEASPETTPEPTDNEED